MYCVKCECEESKVVDSRASEGNSIRRRRECLNCKYRFTTYETIENTAIMVVKKTGEIQKFDKNKILNSILKACGKRPIKREQLEQLVQDIENELLNEFKKEIDSSNIGDLVIEKLKQVDDIAYIRFVSLYKKFKDMEEFREELDKL